MVLKYFQLYLVLILSSTLVHAGDYKTANDWRYTPNHFYKRLAASVENHDDEALMARCDLVGESCAIYIAILEGCLKKEGVYIEAEYTSNNSDNNINRKLFFRCLRHKGKSYLVTSDFDWLVGLAKKIGPNNDHMIFKRYGYELTRFSLNGIEEALVSMKREYDKEQQKIQ